MHQDLLHSITSRRVVNLGVNADLAGHVNVAVRVHVDVADAVSVAQHSNLGVLLDVGHQRIAASGNDQVDDIIQLEQLIYICSGGDQADDVPANLQWPHRPEMTCLTCTVAQQLSVECIHWHAVEGECDLAVAERHNQQSVLADVALEVIRTGFFAYSKDHRMSVLTT